LYAGSPARRVRQLSGREIEQLRYSAEHYVRIKDCYRAGENAL
jgi:carbonic anhydrase/acetyltransferase-like protein (isoleucine patch superfamily)